MTRHYLTDKKVHIKNLYISTIILNSKMGATDVLTCISIRFITRENPYYADSVTIN